ncbi:MAG: hypothetical protein ACLT3Y_00455 [Ruminococcus callidus]
MLSTFITTNFLINERNFYGLFKYDISVINTDVGKLNALSNKEINDLTIETQNAGDTIDKIRELIPQLNALHRSINNLIEATATATQATLIK